MRVGFNPHKDKSHGDSGYIHQVIVPVFIPQTDGYFKDSLQILQYCIDSLLRTSHEKTFITVVNNGSCSQVCGYLDTLATDGKIQELIHSTNIGKLNAVLKGMTGHNFPLVTVTDSDVLFLNHWQQETYRVFDVFPKAGAVCPTPSSRSYKTYTYNIWFDLFFSKRLQFTNVKNPEALKAFAHSINSPKLYNESHLEKYLTVEKQGVRAVVGAGHFVATYKNAIFESLPTKYSGYKLGGDSEKEILDLPVVKKGFWRLSTEDNFAYHMGNTIEPWMPETLNRLVGNTFEAPAAFHLNTKATGKWMYFIKSRLFAKLISGRTGVAWFLKYKGLSSQLLKRYRTNTI